MRQRLTCYSYDVIEGNLEKSLRGLFISSILALRASDEKNLILKLKQLKLGLLCGLQ